MVLVDVLHRLTQIISFFNVQYVRFPAEEPLY